MSCKIKSTFLTLALIGVNLLSCTSLRDEMKDFQRSLQEHKNCDDIVKDVVEFREDLFKRSESLEITTSFDRNTLHAKIVGPASFVNHFSGCNRTHPDFSIDWDNEVTKELDWEELSDCSTLAERKFSVNGNYFVYGAVYGEEDEEHFAELKNEYIKVLKISSFKKNNVKRPFKVKLLKKNIDGNKALEGLFLMRFYLLQRLGMYALKCTIEIVA